LKKFPIHHLEADAPRATARRQCFFSVLTQIYSAYAALLSAHRFLAAAAIFARASGLTLRLAFAFAAGFPTAFTSVAGAFSPLIFAQRAFCAATILARASGDKVRFFLTALLAADADLAGVDETARPRREASSDSNC
jgi:hypothetical protein